MARTQLLSQDWYRLADLKPRLRQQVDVALHDYLGRAWFVLSDKSSGKSFRVPAEDFDILRRFDGKTTVDRIWNDLAWSQRRDLPPQDEFIELVSKLYEGGLLNVDAVPRTQTLARTQNAKRTEWVSRFLKSPVTQKIPLFNPSALLRRPALTWIAHLVFGPVGFVLWAMLILAAGVTAIERWQPLTENLADRALAPSNLIVLACVYPAVKLIHEFAHALAVRRFGGDVTQVGVMFLVFVPMPYVDASDANRFASHSSRALVAGAGILAEFAIGAAAILLWDQADPGLWRAVLFNAIFICTVSTLLFNGNPLLRFDAYYAVADLTQTPGLGTRGQKLLGRRFKRFLAMDPGPDTELAGASARAWMSSYAVLAGIYRLVITFSIALVVAGKLPYVGQVLAVWVVIGGLIWPNVKTVWDMSRSAEFTQKRGKVGMRVIALLAGVAGALLLLPLPSHTTVPALVTNAQGAAVFAETEGMVVALDATPGAKIEVGDVLMRLEPERLRTEKIAMAARIAAASAKLRQAASAANTPLAEAVGRELRALSESLERIDAQLGVADVHANNAGVWNPETPLPRLGQFIARGARIGWIDRPEARRMVARLPETALRDLQRGVTGGTVLLGLGQTVDVPAKDIHLRPNATRQLSDDRMADRLGGPVMTEVTDDGKGLRALETGFPVEVNMDLSDLPVGRIVQLKLRYPAEPLFFRVWPRVVSIVSERFGPGR
ncbi:hypothetical protein [Pseudogemmobacter sp. W21_MBD1_M6]|uniref:hypothetical protein n=1 Tax=Pseudogemmobacter sp. W21_MBD1_M6 TaxID=3240271 RepID=UPI003F9CF41A